MHKYMYSQSEPGKVVHVGTLLTQGVRVFLIFFPTLTQNGPTSIYFRAEPLM